MSLDVLLEELEVLESIYPTELQRISDHHIEIEAEPDDLLDGAENLKVNLSVYYTDAYPDVLPKLTLGVLEGDIEEDEISTLLDALHEMGKENLGMAMTFTLVSHLREQLSKLVRTKKAEHDRVEKERERLALEAEEMKTRGTLVTLEAFTVWKAKFDKEQSEKKLQEEDEKLKALTPKEREEYKKSLIRLTGRQLFERNKNLDEDALIEEGTISVDVSQYERRQEEEEQDEILTFSDSD